MTLGSLNYLQHEKNQHTTSTTAVVYKTEDDNENV